MKKRINLRLLISMSAFLFMLGQVNLAKAEDAADTGSNAAAPAANNSGDQKPALQTETPAADKAAEKQAVEKTASEKNAGEKKLVEQKAVEKKAPPRDMRGMSQRPAPGPQNRQNYSSRDNYRSAPPPSYRSGPPPSYRSGPSPSYRSGPPSSYRSGPPPSYRDRDYGRYDRRDDRIMPWESDSMPWKNRKGRDRKSLFSKDRFSDAWDDMLNAPGDMGEMPGGWTAPSVSMPNPVDVGEEFEDAAKDAPDQMRNVYDDNRRSNDRRGPYNRSRPDYRRDYGPGYRSGYGPRY